MKKALVKREANLTLPGKIHKVGLELQENLSFEEWQKCGELLQQIEVSVINSYFYGLLRNIRNRSI